MRTILCSGGFDPLHVGHVSYLKAAYKIGEVVVALNSDAWLERKKGYVFMPWKDRAQIVGALFCVNAVYPVDDDDGTICAALRELRPYAHANGGDRTVPSPTEDDVCAELGIKQLFGVGGDKIASSSQLVETAKSLSLERHTA